MSQDKKRSNLILAIEERFIFKILTCITLCSFIILCFLVLNKMIDKRKFREYIITNDIKLINSIEDVNIENDYINISGYAFIIEKNILESEISIFLRNVITEQEVWLNTEQVYRPDVNEYYNFKYDYSNSGFKSSARLKQIKQNETYEIIVNIDYIEKIDNINKEKTRKTVSTNQYLLDNKIYTYNPENFDIPEMNINSMLLREVFLNGQLCFYNRTIGMYIYQYRDSLYWIASENFVFGEKETYIPYQIFTSDIYKLPENCISYGFEILDFNFENYEYKDEETFPYRVAIREMPQEYPITFIISGVYDRDMKETLWSNTFQVYNKLN